jgi:hypothetical protein
MAEAPRAGVDQHRHLVLAQAERLGRSRIEDPRHALHLEEVVARPERAELISAAQPGALRHRRRLGAGEAPFGFGVLDVLRGADAVLGQQDPRTLHQHPVKRRALQLQRPAVARADRHPPGDLVHERLGPPAQLRGSQRQR